MHKYDRLGSKYLFLSFGDPQAVNDNSYVIPSQTPMLIDPVSLRGAYCNIMVDCIGEVRWDSGWAFSKSPGYFVMNSSPGGLSSWIDKSIERYDVSDDELKKLKDFQATLDEDDNNIVIFGRWK